MSPVMGNQESHLREVTEENVVTVVVQCQESAFWNRPELGLQQIYSLTRMFRSPCWGSLHPETGTS